MSVRVMTAVWELDLPDSEKIVLLALADCANDEGLCWPSMATLSKKCSKSERTVQAAIKKLVADDHLEQEINPGKGAKYIVHPRSHRTPAAITPLQPLGGEPRNLGGDTPAAAADKPSKNHKEPSNDPPAEADDILLPSHVVEQWNDLAPSMGKASVRDLTPSRRDLVKARIAQYDIDDFVTVFGNVQDSKFLRDWRGCGFDWVMKRGNFQKILEGNYNG